jgi:hypothetical protein
MPCVFNVVCCIKSSLHQEIYSFTNLGPSVHPGIVLATFGCMVWKDGYEVVDFQTRLFQGEVFMRYMWMVAGGSNNSKMAGTVTDECGTDAPITPYTHWPPGRPPFLHGSTSVWAVVRSLYNSPFHLCSQVKSASK